jgi:hypothetical protein
MAPFDADEAAKALAGMLEWYAFTGVAFAGSQPIDPRGPGAAMLSDLWARALTGAPLRAEPQPVPTPSADPAGAGLVGGAPPA